jgi:hypothetical protein
MRLCLKTSVDVRIKCYTMPSFRSHLEFNLVGLIPIVVKAVGIPESSDFSIVSALEMLVFDVCSLSL